MAEDKRSGGLFCPGSPVACLPLKCPQIAGNTPTLPTPQSKTRGTAHHAHRLHNLLVCIDVNTKNTKQMSNHNSTLKDWFGQDTQEFIDFAKTQPDLLIALHDALSEGFSQSDEGRVPDGEDGDYMAILESLEVAKIEIANLKKLVASLERQGANLLKDLQTAEMANDDADARVADLANSKIQLKSQLKDLQQQIIEITQVAQDAQLEAQEHQTMTELLQTDIASLNDRIVYLEEQIYALENVQIELQNMELLLETERGEHQLQSYNSVRTEPIELSIELPMAKESIEKPIVATESVGVQRDERVWYIGAEWVIVVLLLRLATFMYPTFIYSVFTYQHGTLDSSKWKHLLVQTIHEWESREINM